MRTRRSPRNQERLWRALGGPTEAKPKRTRLPSRAEARAKLFADQRDRWQHGMMTHKEAEEALGEPVDPNATWQCLIESLKDLNKSPQNGDTRAHVVDCLNVLATWIHRGGFPPKMEA